jgi:hypothetical protein
MRCFALILMLLTSTSAQITDPGEVPSFSSLQGCVQVLFSDTGEELLNDIGCGDWFCACNHFGDAIYTLSTMAVSQCSTVAQDVSAATSVFSSFCSQISTSPTTTFYPTGLTDPFGWPNFSTLRSRVQDLFGGGEELINDVNCVDWSCVCADPGAPYTLSTLAASQCTDAQDISAANSVFTAFCNQISLTASVPTAPTGVSQTAGTPCLYCLIFLRSNAISISYRICWKFQWYNWIFIVYRNGRNFHVRKPGTCRSH